MALYMAVEIPINGKYVPNSYTFGEYCDLLLFATCWALFFIAWLVVYFAEAAFLAQFLFFQAGAMQTTMVMVLIMYALMFSGKEVK